MRLFLYYAFHTVVNTIKKLFKTWLAFIVIIGLAAGLLGMLIGRIVPLVEKSIKGDTAVEEAVEEEVETDSVKSNIRIFLDDRDLNAYDLVDLCVTGAFLLFVTLVLLTVNKGGEIFKPADVPLLFASPMKPQSVLMFRLMNSLGTNVIIAFYMLFQLPNLVNNLHVSLWSALTMFLAYMLTMIFTTLLQISTYAFSRNSKNGKINVTSILLGFYGALAAAFMIYTAVTKQEVLTAAFRFFGNKKTFWIPFIGWIRGMVYYSVIGDTTKTIIYIALFSLSCIAAIILIWNIKVDFYEDALTATERVAAKLENSQKIAKGGSVTREKDRNRNLQREGFEYGSGASVFFYKAIYNRLRFAKFKLLSKTFIVYLFASVFGGWLALKIKNPYIDKFMIPAVVIMGIAFYRTLGNPLEEDTSREFFVLIPDPPIKKIWASILGSLTVCLIDMSIPLIVAAIITKANPLTVIAWVVFILSVTLFGTTVGAFVNISIPGDHAQTVKMMVQIMFVYFGAIPSIGFVIAGIVMKNMGIMLLAGSLFNFVFGALFTFITPRFLMNR
ncbi:MAG: putative ABC exporter domain-containing protein [Lachnospiraceae bacterium]|nr:putative ABC exporter domain-containing protein [Lachnospiraceae bacterium]